MILAVFDGYYRSGTTIWQREVERAGVTVIHEPHSPTLLHELIKRKGAEIHGFDVRRGFYRLERPILAKLIMEWKHCNGSVITDPKKAMKLLEILDESRVELVVKSNQLYPVLDRISDRWECCFIEREVDGIVQGHFEIFPCKKKMARMLNTNDRCFFCDSIHYTLFRIRYKPAALKIAENAMKAKELANCKHVYYEKPETIRKFFKKLGIVTGIVRPINGNGVWREWLR